MFSILIAMLGQAAPVGSATEPIAISEDEQLPSDGLAAVDSPTDSEVLLQSQGVKSNELVAAKGHKIFITIEAQMGSKISQAKEFFPIKLAQAVEIDGVEVLPAGIVGEGQVVHAKKSGFGASAGELILAARYLEHEGRRIPLRSFRFIEEGDELPFKGKDNSGVAIAATAVLLPLGLLIGGGNTTIEPGTLATAKFRADETFFIAKDVGLKRKADTSAGAVGTETEMKKASAKPAAGQPENDTDQLDQVRGKT
ncbi:hypothetical protein QWY75_01735 [Pontixanthobacter aestiaquae]|uniref:Uncharacterized protein n=1 Tax=Pontixanthobacter aestiaquae TaxID=1509367 RepID=A0A844ZAM0_9SPHN|nr:hypothetical protein [Pontixanthobacter aestiaquae]MDN3644922.1 hypothetical protein [Pontixanthobacter aestiaquae]MXO84077.1 hypothetical protein [Pontixanthobacter aestiaquae]